MSPNQRLMVAVGLSILFFVVYTAIFPPKEKLDTQNPNNIVALKDAKKIEPTSTTTSSTDNTPSSVAKTASNDIVTVKADDFILTIDTLGRIASKELLQEKYNTKDNKHAQMIQKFATKPLFIRFMDEDLNKEAKRTPYTANVTTITLTKGEAKKVTLTQKLSKLTVTKELTFYDDGHYDATVKLSKEKRYFIYLGERPKVNKKEQMMAAVGALIYSDDNVLTIIQDGDMEGRKTFTGVQLIASFDQYTASIMYGFKKDTTILVERDADNNPLVYFDALPTMSFHGYIGPKNYDILKSIDPILVNTIEYGWFTFASKPLFAVLAYLHGIFGNWGWSIIALTILIRLILYPLTYKGMVSMQKMKAIAPKIKEIQAKYKSDPQRMNAAVMEMYKKHGANPLGGCLPMLLQIPVFFAIYRVLLNAEELQGAPWILWINDLSRMDPYFVLPILMGASMYFQQRMTPNNFTDPLQAKVFKFLPIIFTFFFMTFPSGLVLYWFVNNLFSMLQQFIVNQQFKNKEDLEKAIKNK